jgi:hypothetical protein
MTATINASTSSGVILTSDTSGSLAIQSNGTTVLTATSTGLVAGASIITSMTAQASTSGTSIDFTSIPSWVKRVTVLLNGVSLSGTANIRLQLGVSGTPETTGYSAGSAVITSSSVGNYTASTSGIDMFGSIATYAISGAIQINLLGSNTWTFSGNTYNATSTPYVQYTGGGKTLAGTLNMVRITSSNGTDTFDAGSINILYE